MLDEEISAICKKLQEGKLLDKKFEVKNGLLFKKGRLFLSSLSPMKGQILQFIHNSAFRAFWLLEISALSKG